MQQQDPGSELWNAVRGRAETDIGTVRLYQKGSEAPDIGPSRTLPVSKRDGFWGYPRYTISEDEQ